MTFAGAAALTALVCFVLLLAFTVRRGWHVIAVEEPPRWLGPVMTVLAVLTVVLLLVAIWSGVAS